MVTKLKNTEASKFTVLWIVLLIVFIAEVSVMAILHFLDVQSSLIETLLDGVFLSLISAPFLYHFLIKNIINKNAELLHGFKRQKEALDQSALVSETDLHGRITYANKMFCKVSQYSKDELMGQSHKIVNSGYHDKEFWKIFWSDLRENRSWSGEICNKAKDGTFYWVNAFVTAILNSDNKLVGYSAIRVDITDKKIAEEKERKALAIRAEFLANMSHEIRTPMNGVLGMLDLLSDTTLDNEQNNMLNSVISCGNELMTILNDVLDLSKIESGKLELEFRSFDLRGCLDELTYLNSSQCAEKNIDLSVSVDKQLPKYLIGDVTRIKQIMQNYISNALKFTPKKGQININLTCEDFFNKTYKVKFSVKDTGIGISAGHQLDLFKAFTQADSSITRKYGGTGLGLSISSNLVRIMNGTFSVESELGKGSTFNFTLSLKKCDKEPENESIVEEIDKEIKHHKILVVDDNIVNQKIASKMLEKIGFNCDIVNDGLEAVKAVELAMNDPYTIIFMDLHMPNMDGLEATKIILDKMKNKDRKSHIVAMTANAFKEERDVCFDAGMSDFISKPVKKMDFYRVLKKHC